MRLKMVLRSSLAVLGILFTDFLDTQDHLFTLAFALFGHLSDYFRRWRPAESIAFDPFSIVRSGRVRNGQPGRRAGPAAGFSFAQLELVLEYRVGKVYAQKSGFR